MAISQVSATKRQDTISCLGFIYEKTLLKYQTTAESQYLKITEILSSSTAQKVGLKAGDLITKINDRDVSSLKITTCSDILNGPSGTNVCLQIKRNEQEFDIVLQRTEPIKAQRGRPVNSNKDFFTKFCMRINKKIYEIYKTYCSQNRISVSIQTRALYKQMID